MGISSPERKAAWKGRRVLVTGAGGFVAGHLARSLVDLGAEVTAIIRDSRGMERLALLGIEKKVQVLRGSITEYDVVERGFNEYETEYCFHLAAQAIVGAANRSPLSTFESNIHGTWTLLEAARLSPLLKGFVFASSDKVYGDQPVLPYTEDSPLSAVYPYDASKLCAETLVRSYARTFDLPVAIARCANIYGGGDLNWSRLVPGTVRSVLQGERPIVRSDGTLQRDYMHVDDAADAYLTLAENVGREDVRGEKFNFGWGHGYPVLTVVQEILNAASAPFEPVVLGQNKGEIKDQWLSSEKALRVLDWRPSVVLGEGISEAVDWYRGYLEQMAERPTSGVAVNGGGA
jgi:CDP-glucose 4,6-dehydratase